MGKRLILLGPPGAGKGTQSGALSKLLGIPSISTGNLLRSAICAGSELGVKAKGYMDKGNLVPDEIVLWLLAERLRSADCADGFILDGVPRTLAQAEAIEKDGVAFDCVLSIEISDNEIVERMSGRRTCSQCAKPYHVVNQPSKVANVCDECGGELLLRTDDAAEVVLQRLETYHRQTEPLKGFYAARGLLRKVESQADIPSTTEKMMEALRDE